MKNLLIEIADKPLVTIVTAVPVILVAPQVNILEVSWLLFYLFCADLFTGIAAAYFVWKKQPNTEDKWFFGKGEGFSSAKFKQCFFKIITYAGTPWIVLKFQQTFLIEPMKFPTITNAQMDLTVLLLLVFCLVETFSIFWENLPKCGVNIPRSIKRFIVGVKDISDSAKDKDEYNQNLE